MKKNINIKQWEILITTIPQPAFIHDSDSTILLANEQLLSLFSKKDVTGLKCYELIRTDESLKIAECPHKKLLSDTPVSTEIYDRFLDKYIVLMTSPLRVNGDIFGCLHTITDITEIKKSEIESSGLVDIYATSINEIKKREVIHRKGREAFLNMLDDVNESFKELESLFLNLVKAMIYTLDAKSTWTKGHSERVAQYAEMIAREMGFDEEDLKTLHLAGLLHDIGKIGTYDYLLDKPSRLTDEEFEIVKKHPVQGADIIKEIKQLKDIVPIIRNHHERIDGKGYPDGLKGEEIPIFARILHVADSFDSMTSDRPYRPSPGIDYAVSELKKFRGIQFDKKVVDVFIDIIEKGKLKKVTTGS
jgi:putative nucleotidyltransferase with HDIG domain/PAS domain S-box-containing protein